MVFFIVTYSLWHFNVLYRMPILTYDLEFLSELWFPLGNSFRHGYRRATFLKEEGFSSCRKLSLFAKRAPSVRGLSPLGDWGSSPKYFCIGSFLSITVFQGPSCELFSIICHSIGKSFSPYSVHFICRISIL